MPSNLDIALSYLRRGWSVMPVGANKIPSLPSWKFLQERLPTEDEVSKWWIQNPDANIGIITGSISGLTVVDIEKDGDCSKFPATLISRTGGGGFHYFYKYEPGVTNKARIFDLVDLRGVGGYVVAPPSLHASGNRYEWMNEGFPLAPFPRDIFLFADANRSLSSKVDWNEVLQGVGQGSRNETAAKCAGLIMRQIPKDEWEVIGWPQLMIWNSRNSPPLPDRELRMVWDSIAKRAIYDVPRLQKGQSLIAHEQPKTEDAVEAIEWNEALKLGENELLCTKPQDCLSYGYNFLDDQLTGIFPGELIVVGGITGTGKSQFTMNTVMKAADRGHRCFVFALEDRVEEYAIRALFYRLNRMASETYGAVQEKYQWNLFRKNSYDGDIFRAELQKAKDSLANSNVHFAKVKGRMTYEMMEATVEKEVGNNTGLFLCDHLHYFELDKKDMTRAEYIENFMVNLRGLQRRTKARVILVCHYKKTGDSMPTLDSFKDSISIVQNASYVINIWRDRGQGQQNGKGKGDSVIRALEQFRGSSDGRFVKTFFVIPKARNPNGEGVIIADYDRVKGDYVDKPASEMKPMTEMPKPKTNEELAKEFPSGQIPISMLDW